MKVWIVVTFPDTEAADAVRLSKIEVRSERPAAVDGIQHIYEAEVDGETTRAATDTAQVALAVNHSLAYGGHPLFDDSTSYVAGSKIRITLESGEMFDVTVEPADIRDEHRI